MCIRDRAKGERGSCGLSVQDSVGITIVGNTISEGGPLKGGPQVPEIEVYKRQAEVSRIYIRDVLGL